MDMIVNKNDKQHHLTNGQLVEK
jgi:hypothetical protein